jgi:microcystin-dependent protein
MALFAPNKVVWSNFYVTTASLGIGTTDTILSVPTTTGSPSISGSQYFYLVLQTVDGLTLEVVKVTGMTSNTFTIERGMDGTSPAAFPEGAAVYCAPTAGTLADRFAELDTYMGNAITAMQAQVAAMANAFPIGEIIFLPYAYSAVVLPNFLLCEGSLLSRVTYANLFNRVGTAYGAGDGETTFGTPDYRGYFLRIQDNGAGNDPNAAVRAARGDGTGGDAPGTVQGWILGRHVHPTGGNTGKATGGASVIDPQAFNTPSPTSGYNCYTLDFGAEDTINPASYANVPQGLETRPININVVAAIRFQ